MFHFGGFPSLYYFIHIMILDSSSRWFPNSEICGSMLIYSSPQLIAVSHVLRRLPMPRHSPYALFRLNFSFLWMIAHSCASIANNFSVVSYCYFRLCAKNVVFYQLYGKTYVLFFSLLLEDNFQSFSIICFVFVLYSVFNEHISALGFTLI